MSNIDNLDDELDELSKDTTLKDLLKFRTRMPTKASPQLEQRLRASYKQHLAKRKKKDLFSKLKGWYANLSTENIRFRYAIPLGTLAVTSLIIGVGIYAFFYKEKTTEIGALHNTPTPINTPSPLATDAVRSSGNSTITNLKNVKTICINIENKQLKAELTIQFKSLDWKVIDNPDLDNITFELENNYKLVILNKDAETLWDKIIDPKDISINSRKLAEDIVKDLSNRIKGK